MKNVNQKIKKYIRFLLVILVIIFSNFQSGYSEWVKQDLINKLNLDLGTIQQFKINTKNELIVLNKDNEIITINFETGEISNRCKCEIDSAATFISMSSDGNYTIMQYYDKNLVEHNFVDEFELKTTFNIYDNLNCRIKEKVERDFKIIGGQYGSKVTWFGNKLVDYDYNSNQILYNIGINESEYGGGSGIQYRYHKFFQIYNIVNKDVKFNLNSEYESILYDLKDFKNIFIASTYNYYSYDPSFYNKLIISHLYYFNPDSNKIILKFDHTYEEGAHKNGPTTYKGKYFILKKILKHYDPNKLYLLVDTNRNNSNNKMVLYEYEISKNNLKRLSEIETQNSTFIMDDNNKLFKISNNIIELYNLNNSISPINTLILPDNIFNTTFSYSDNQTTIVFNNGNFIFKFTNDKLKHINNNGFTSDKQILNIDSNVTFVSEAKMKGLKFEWELEPNLIIKTDLPFVNYKYKNAGNYDIKLKVTDLNNKDYYYSIENYITVLPNLKAEFNFKEDNDLPGTFHFENTSNGNPQSQSWFVNDSLISNEKDFSHKFYLFGDFKIKLIVNNEISSDTIEKVINFRKNQKVEINDSTKIVKFIFSTKGGLFSSELINNKLIFIAKDYKLSSYSALGIITYEISINIYNYNLIDNKLLLNAYGYGDTMQIEKINYDKLQILNNIFINDGIYPITILFNNSIDNFKLGDKYDFYYNYNNNKFLIDRSHKVDDNNINTFILEKPDSILMRNITITPKAINSNYLTFDKNIKNFETEFRENINYLLLKYQDSTFSLNQYKFFAKKISDVINLPKSFEISKLSLKGDNLYILGNEPFVDIKRGVIYKYNISTKGLEKFESDTYNNFTKIKWINDKSFVAWGEQSGSKGFVFMRNNLDVIKSNIYLNITGQINNIFFEDKKLTMVYENQAGSNFNVFIGEDEFTDEFMEVLSNNEVSDEIIIYPNPTSNKIKILQQDKLFSISIYNITGLEVFSQQDLNSETEIDLGKLPTGNYWLKINNLDKMYSIQVNR